MNIGDAVFMEYLVYIEGHIVAHITGEGLSFYTHPQNNWCWFVNYTNTDYIKAGPIHPVGDKIHDDLIGEAGLPNVGKSMLTSGAEHFGLQITPCASGWVPRLSVQTSYMS